MKTPVGQTYYHNEFITEEERIIVKEWAIRNEKYLIPNPSGPFRARQLLKLIPEKLGLLNEIKERIIEVEGIGKEIFEPFRGDFVSIHRNGSKVLEHIDPNPENETLYSRRYNVFISLPEKGGLPIYNDEVLHVSEKCLLKVDSGLIPHSTTIIEGNIPRIILSYGFAFKK
jgi:hypothetical protein